MWIQVFFKGAKPGGLGDAGPLVGSRGKAPVTKADVKYLYNC